MDSSGSTLAHGAGHTSTQILVSDAPGGAFRPFVDDVEVRLSSRGAPWEDALVLEVDDVPPAEMADCFPERSTVVLHLAGGSVERIGAQHRFERHAAAIGVIDFDPAGEPTAARWTEPHRLLCLMPTEAILQRALAAVDGPAGVELLRANHVHDPQIERIGHALMAECENGFVSGRLFGESMALALVARLVCRFSARAVRIDALSERGLPLWRVRQVTEYIEENLGSDLRMADLAEVVRLSEFHFCRMFKLSTGVTPYRYIVARRIQRGRELLTKTAMPLHEVSAKLGFGDQSHFTTVFRKSTGMTPKQFRDRSRQ